MWRSTQREGDDKQPIVESGAMDQRKSSNTDRDAVEGGRPVAETRNFFLVPPYGWTYPATGRRDWEPEPSLLAFGQYIKRGRYFARLSQQQLADQAKVDQGQISRLERALAPAMGIERVVRLSSVLGRALPLGYCPHEHWCQWQAAPAEPPERRALSDAEKARYLELILGPDKTSNASDESG